jgi:hypothetical protein
LLIFLFAKAFLFFFYKMVSLFYTILEALSTHPRTQSIFFFKFLWCSTCASRVRESRKKNIYILFEWNFLYKIKQKFDYFDDLIGEITFNFIYFHTKIVLESYQLQVTFCYRYF